VIEVSPFSGTEQSMSPPFPLPEEETNPVSETLCFLVYRTMDEV
jgi:hypothetical protein